MTINSFIYFIIFIFGLIIGSFLNCVIYRLEKNDNPLKGRSYCPHCKHVLSWRDLIPVFSFLALGGKCRYCQKKISIQYPLVELATAILFVSAILFLPPKFVVYYWLNFSFLIIIFVYDLKHYIIPDKIIYPAILLTLIFNFQFLIFNEFSIFKFSILSAIGASLFFLAIILISKGRWMGFGDFKLAIFMGLFLGFPNILVALFFAFFSGAIMGTGLIAAGKKKFKSEIPFGPFLVAGTFTALLWGQGIINWYISLFQL